MGFDGDECDMAEEDLRERLKNLKIDTEIEDRKDDELLRDKLKESPRTSVVG
jgi:hypothetical protein